MQAGNLVKRRKGESVLEDFKVSVVDDEEDFRETRFNGCRSVTWTSKGPRTRKRHWNW
jgi:hypothetical protein